jgi:hypothetical protein
LKAEKIGPGGLSKVAGAALPAFQKKIKNIFGRFQNSRVGSGLLSKALGTAPINLLSNNFNLLVINRF